MAQPALPENQPSYPKDFPQLISTKGVKYNVTDGDGADLTQEPLSSIPYSGQATGTNTFPNPSFTYIVQLDSSSNTYNCTVQWSRNIATITLNQQNGFNLRNYACFLSDASNFSYVYSAQKFSTGILADCPGASHLKGSIFTIGGCFAIASSALDFSSNNPLNTNILDFTVYQYDTGNNGGVPGSKQPWTLNSKNIWADKSDSGCPLIGCCGGQAPTSRSSEFNHPYTQGQPFCPVSMFDFPASYANSPYINYASGPWSKPTDQYSKGTSNDPLVWPQPAPGVYPVGKTHGFTPNGWVGFMPYYLKGDPNSPCPLGFNLGIPPGPPNAYGYGSNGTDGYPTNPNALNSNIFNIDYNYNGGWPIAPYGWKKGDFWRDPDAFFSGQKQADTDTALWSYSLDELNNGIGEVTPPYQGAWGINPPSMTLGGPPGHTPGPKGAPKGANDWRVIAANFGSEFMTGTFMPVSSPYDPLDPGGDGTFNSKRSDEQLQPYPTPQYDKDYAWLASPPTGRNPNGSFPIVTGGPQITIMDPRRTKDRPKVPLGGWWWDISSNPSEAEMERFTPYGQYPDPDHNYYYDTNLGDSQPPAALRLNINPTNYPPPLSATYGTGDTKQPQPYDPKGWKKYPVDSSGKGLIGNPYGCRFSQQNRSNVYLGAGNITSSSNPPPTENGHFNGFGSWGEYAQQPVNPILIKNGLPKVNEASECKDFGWPGGSLSTLPADGSPVDCTYPIYGGLYDEDNPYQQGIQNSVQRMPEGFPSEFNNAYFPGTIQPFISWAFAQENNTSATTGVTGTVPTQNDATEWKLPYPKSQGWNYNWPPSRNKEYEAGNSENVNPGGGDKSANFKAFYNGNTLNGWYPTRQQINKRIKYPPVAATGFEMKFGVDPSNNPWKYYPGSLEKSAGTQNLIDTFIFRRAMKINPQSPGETFPRPIPIDVNMSTSVAKSTKEAQNAVYDEYVGKQDVSVQFFLLDIIPNNSSYGAVWGQYAPPLPDAPPAQPNYPPVFEPGESDANSDQANQFQRTLTSTNPTNAPTIRAQQDPSKGSKGLGNVSFPIPNNLSEEINTGGFEITERFGKPILTYPTTTNVAAIKQNPNFYDYSGINFTGQSNQNPFQSPWIPNILQNLQPNSEITSTERPEFENNLCTKPGTYKNPVASSWICGGLKQVSYGTNEFIENRQNSCAPLTKAYPACIKSNNARKYFPMPSNVQGIKDGIGQQFFDGIPAVQYKIQQPGLIDDLPQLRRQIIYGDTSDARAPRYNSYFIPGLSESAQDRDQKGPPSNNLLNYFQTPRAKFKAASVSLPSLLTLKYDPAQENMNYAPSLSLLDYFYQPWVLGDIDATLTNLQDFSFCLYTSIIRQQWVPNQIPMAKEATGTQSGPGPPPNPNNLPANNNPYEPLPTNNIQGWNCDWCGGGKGEDGHPNNSSFFGLFTGNPQNSLSNIPDPDGISEGLGALSNTASAAFHICFPGEKPPPEPETEPEPFNPPLVPGGNVGPEANPNPEGPQSVFFLEGRCLNGQYNCKWVRPRPWLSINYQPIAGQPLPYKYIATMGSLLAKKRQNANIIQNATAHRKNTVVFISRGDQCGVVEPCPLFKAPAKCPQCTGNRNPNNNPL
jgi:hypothetical protein